MNTTSHFCILVTIFCIAYDIYVYLQNGYQATISQAMLCGARCYPLLPLAFGVLMGHWFWPATHTGRPWDSPIVVLFLGVVMGRWLWPQ